MLRTLACSWACFVMHVADCILLCVCWSCFVVCVCVCVCVRVCVCYWPYLVTWACALSPWSQEHWRHRSNLELRVYLVLSLFLFLCAVVHTSCRYPSKDCKKHGGELGGFLTSKKQEWLDLGCPFTSGETRMARFVMSFHIWRNKNGKICDVISHLEKQEWQDLWCHFTSGAVGWMCRVWLGFAVGCMGQLRAECDSELQQGGCGPLNSKCAQGAPYPRFRYPAQVDGVAGTCMWLQTSGLGTCSLSQVACPGKYQHALCQRQRM